MYPNNEQPQPVPDSYLDQIASKPTKKIDIFSNKLIFFGLIGSVVIIIFIFILSAITSSTQPDEQLAARLLSTQSTLDSSTSQVKSTKLRTSNSNLKIYLSNTIRDITPLLKKDNIDITKLDKSITAAESNTKLLATLEDARLNAIYDRTYAHEMAYKLDTILTLMQQTHDKSNSKTYRAFLEEARANLEPIQTQFADFNETNS